MKWFTASVLLCVAKCFAMSFDELQDFSNYLKEKSLLDQPLKKNPADENDEDDPVSDHAWEESGRFEGDLILNDRQRQLIVQDVAEGLSRNGLKDSTKRWPDNEVIYYIQKEHFSSDQVQAILSGIDDLSRASCVKFRPYKKGDRDAVVVQGSRRGCFSQVGYQGGYQVLNLSGRHPVGRGCFRHGTVVHEFLHTLGFYHMQSSPDRDDYIDVIWENIVQPARHNFRKYNLFSVSDFGVGYDYDSVLHYSRKAFSSNGRDTLVPKKGGVDIGQRVGLSDKDTAKLNKMYCDGDSNNFEAEETGPHVPIIKKKKPKNKPFEGHGIGYHQGKTVVIKLPAAETYRLPDTPSYHVFDYFSEAPQAMSPALVDGFGIGKKITYSYMLPAVFKTSFNSGLPSTLNTAIEPKTKQEPGKSKNDEVKPTAVIVDIVKSKDPMGDSDEKTMKEEKSYTEQQQFHKGFDQLGEVVKSKVHPESYKPNTDYSEFYNPINVNPVTSKTDYYLIYKPSLKEVNAPDYTSKEITNLKLTRQFIDTLHVPRSTTLLEEKIKEENHDRGEVKHEAKTESKHERNDKSLGEVDLTFGKVYPHKRLQEIRGIYNLKPEYTLLKYLENKQDYSRYYNPNDKVIGSEVRNAQHSLYGENVPFTGNWPQSDTENHSPNVNSKIHDKTNRRKDMESDEIINQHVIYPIKPPSFHYEGEIKTEEEEYSSEFNDPNNVTEKHDKAEITEDYDKSSKSYEVTENIKDVVETVTEKFNADDDDDDQSGGTLNLEDRLPDILKRYTSFDKYDIALPYVSSEFDTDVSS